MSFGHRANRAFNALAYASHLKRIAVARASAELSKAARVRSSVLQVLFDEIDYLTTLSGGKLHE